ncbi:MAG: hypothetical protein IPH14_07300 [Thermomonas sp.]|uniref:hypothetical protein n=1 Tax=Thermomonas sp. TaxID=1971895 RepID=UPI0025CF1C35|nr:hypothetical protein [Thermomonas sp.]MBK6925050.1 hypothetical protein [Thermomonas sp.]
MLDEIWFGSNVLATSTSEAVSSTWPWVPPMQGGAADEIDAVLRLLDHRGGRVSQAQAYFEPGEFQMR